ncbi:MAG: MBL fold metallo-hydrolase, partial [Myxococcota bacterium]
MPVITIAAASAGIIGGVGALAGIRTVRGALGVTRYAGVVSPHFDGRRFANSEPAPGHSGREMLKRAFTVRTKPRHRYDDIPSNYPPPLTVVESGALSVTYINHATTLIQMDGINILTDPVWSMRIGPVTWAGYKRIRPAGVRFEDLPRIDVVLISHNHYDHMDIPTVKALLARGDTPLWLGGLGTGQALADAGAGRVVEMDWWNDVALPCGVTITSVPARHFSARGVTDRNMTLWCGFVISGSRGPVYFAGDTGYGAHFRRIRERFGDIRIAILPIGPFKPEWYMARVHLSPVEAVRA